MDANSAFGPSGRRRPMPGCSIRVMGMLWLLGDRVMEQPSVKDQTDGISLFMDYDLAASLIDREREVDLIIRTIQNGGKLFLIGPTPSAISKRSKDLGRC